MEGGCATEASEEQHRRSDEFDSLCVNVLSSFHVLGKALEELHGFKDELLNHSLPTRMVMRLSILTSQIVRSQSDLCVPLNELIRMVRLYSGSWEEKAAVLKQIQEQQESKQKQLTIALKRIELLASESEKLDQQRASGNWAMLFSKVLMGKSHGRRWKFRIEEFKKNSEHGFSKFNPFGLSAHDGGLRQSAGSGWESGVSENELKSSRFTSDADLDTVSSLSERRSSLLSRRDSKKVKFTDLTPDSQVKIVAPPKPVMLDKMVSTDEVEYTGYLLVRLYHPYEVVKDKQLICSLRFRNEMYQTKTFPVAVDTASREFHDFHLELTDVDLKCLKVPNFLDEGSSVKSPSFSVHYLKESTLSVSVHSEFLSQTPAASVNIRMSNVKLEGPPSVLVPPVDRTKVFDIGWDYIAAVLREDDAGMYLCEGGSPYKLKILCHLVKIQKHPRQHCGTSTVPLDECVSALGFKKTRESRSRATSARQADVLERGVVTSLVWESRTDDRKDTMSPQEEVLSAKEIAEMTLNHAKELQALQDQYEAKLETLSQSFQQLKQQKIQQQEEFEAHQQELIAQFTSQLTDQESARKLKAKLVKKPPKKKPSGPLQSWGRDLPEDFFERMELFTRESLRRHAALTERIRSEIAETCERQLAIQHKLAPIGMTQVEEGLNDVCLPALFMPTPLGHTYTPRAHQYFHTSGQGRRVTQPPSIFKLPNLPSPQKKLATINLFELGRHFTESSYPIAMSEPELQDSFTVPPPPPSACSHRKTVNFRK